MRRVLAFAALLSAALLAAIVLVPTAADARSPFFSTMAEGRAAYARRDLDAAERIFQRALREAETDRQRARAHYSLGVVYQHAKKPALARLHAERALRLRPGWEDPRTLLAELEGAERRPPPGSRSTPMQRRTPENGRSKTGAAAACSAPPSRRPAWCGAPTEAWIAQILDGAPRQPHWHGYGIQRSGSSWPMVIEFKGRNATVRYPSLGCSGRWVRTATGRSSITFVEKIDQGRGRCVDNGRIVLVLQKSGNLAFNYFMRGSGQPSARAAVLPGTYLERNQRRLASMTRALPAWSEPRDGTLETRTAEPPPARKPGERQARPRDAAPEPKGRPMVADAKGRILSTPFRHKAVWGDVDVPGCRVKLPSGLTEDPTILKRPIKRSDIVKVIVRSDCRKTMHGLPSDAPKGPFLAKEKLTVYQLSRAYTVALYPNYKTICLAMWGDYKDGAYDGPVAMTVQFSKSETFKCDISGSEAETAAFFRKMPKSHHSRKGYVQVFARDGRLFFDQQALANASGQTGALAKLLSLSVRFRTPAGKSVERGQLTPLIRASGARTDFHMRYALAPLAGKIAELKADKYRVTIGVEIDLTIRGVSMGMETTSTRKLSKDVTVDLLKTKGYQAEGEALIASVATSTSGVVLGMRVSTDVVGAKETVHIKSVEVVK
ncbi:MAG: tetratricopeptide repeat protein [Hyphomicrobiaceae bacterium]|nr:tetratricopeptide repeat protein [Hyphomicrobiaceae bacterium]